MLARIGRQDDSKLASDVFRPRLDSRVVIALRAQQFGKQVGIRTSATANLRGVGRILVLGLECRLLPKLVEQLLGVADWHEAFDLDRIADIARRHRLPPLRILCGGRSWRCSGRGRGVARFQIGPGNAEIRHRVEWRAWIQLGRIGWRLRSRRR